MEKSQSDWYDRVRHEEEDDDDDDDASMNFTQYIPTSYMHTHYIHL